MKIKQGKQEFYYRIANFIIRITFYESEWVSVKQKLQSDVETYLKEFEIKKPSGNPDWNIDVVWDNSFQFLFFRGEKTNYISLYKYKNRNTTITYYRIGLFEFQLILSRVLSALLRKVNGFFLHSSAVKHNGTVAIFIGPSGAGKSTTAKLLAHKYPIMADDFIIIREAEGAYYFHKTPFIDKENIMKFKSTTGRRINASVNRHALGHVFFLKKSLHNRIVKIGRPEAQTGIMKSSIDIMGKLSKKTVNNISDFVKKHDRFYNLYFKKDMHSLTELFGKI